MADRVTGIIEYQNARRAGRRYHSENSGNRFGGKLAVLDELLGIGATGGEISLGTHEIPIKKIVGTYTSTRADAFAGNFMPLMDEGSEFAFKWRSLYGHHIKDGITDPIKVYEYLGLFYVIEGNKRVSVMKFQHAYSIAADITRIVPRYDDTREEIKIYYEIMNFNPRSFAWGDMWFSRHGTFTRMIKLAERFAAANPQLAGAHLESWLPRTYRDFALQYERAGFRDIPMTTGDAFFEYIHVYEIPYELPLGELADKVVACENQFRRAAGQGGTLTIEGAEQPDPDSGRRLFGARKARVVFCYRSLPGNSSWTRTHEAARLAAEKFFEGRVSTSAVYGIADGEAYPGLSAAAENEPDIMFTVNSLFAHDSLKIALEHPDIHVFNCNHSNSYMELNTYFTKLYEQLFVLGAVAGAYTKNDIIGFVDLPTRATDSTYAINAFAQGALLVNHNIRVKRFKPEINYSGEEDRRARRVLAEAGADIAFCQYPTYGSIIAKPYDDLYGMLCQLGKGGVIAEYLAAAAWNWEVQYKRIIGDHLDGMFDLLKRGDRRRADAPGSLYFWLGIGSGAAPVYKVEAALGTHTSRLCDLLTAMVGASRLHPFVGPIRDRDGVLRVAHYDVPSLNDIQNMDWLCDIIE